jgi:hypothetical protein
MDKPKGKLRLLDNPLFQAYVAGLPTISRRILQVSGPEGDKYIVVVREGDNPSVVAREAPEN